MFTEEYGLSSDLFEKVAVAASQPAQYKKNKYLIGQYVPGTLLTRRIQAATATATSTPAVSSTPAPATPAPGMVNKTVGSDTLDALSSTTKIVLLVSGGLLLLFALSKKRR